MTVAGSVRRWIGRGLRPRLFLIVISACWIGGALAPESAFATGDIHPNRELITNPTIRRSPCVDAKVAPLVGLDRVEALKRVRKMNLLALRILDPLSPVNYEVYPERLTLVIDPDGRVGRAFCR